MSKDHTALTFSGVGPQGTAGQGRGDLWSCHPRKTESPHKHRRAQWDHRISATGCLSLELSITGELKQLGCDLEQDSSIGWDMSGHIHSPRTPGV